MAKDLYRGDREYAGAFLRAFTRLSGKRNNMTSWVTHACVLFAVGAAFAATPENELPEQFRQPFTESYDIRKECFGAMRDYLSSLRVRQSAEMEEVFDQDFSSPAAYERSLEPFRDAVRLSLGIPPPGVVAEPGVRLEQIGEDRHAIIYRAWITVIEGVELYSLYMVPKGLTGTAPLIIAQHGGSGCPEAICDLDTRVNYDSFGPKAVQRGYIVWAPYSVMPATYAGDSGEEINRGLLESQAADAGVNLRGIEVYQIARGVEVLAAARPEIDAGRIGMTGLSYGGGMTLMTMALSPIIRVGVASAGFRGTGRRTGANSVQLAAAICPRPLMIQSGDTDTVVPMEDVLPGIPQVEAFYDKLGLSNRFVFDRHSGAHVFVTANVLDFFDRHLR